MTHFRTRPAVVDAEQFDGTRESAERIQAWAGGGVSWLASELPPVTQGAFVITVVHLLVPTLDGNHTRVIAGQWVIRSIGGRFIVSDPETFESTHEALPAGSSWRPIQEHA